MSAFVEEIKRAAADRWPEILTSIGGIPAELLDGKKHPCPKCGGKDRFRFIDPVAGAVLCNSCFNKKNGDGLAALCWMLNRPNSGKDFYEVVGMVAEMLGIRKPPAEKEPPVKPKVFFTQDGIVKNFILTLQNRSGGEVALAGSWDYGTFTVLRFNLPTPDGDKQRKEFRPIRQAPLGDEGRMGWTWGYPAGPRPIYRKLEVDAASPELMTIHGGEKAADAAALMGLLATTNAGGEQAIDQTDWSPAARFQVAVVCIDADETGERFGRTLASKLLAQNPEQVVKILRVSNEPKGDIVEAIRDGLTKERFLALVEGTAPVTAEEAAAWAKKRPAQSRPKPEREIEIGTDEGRVVDEAIDVLSDRENVYQRGGNLVQIVEGAEPPRGIARPPEAPRIAVMRSARIREHLADGAVWFKLSGDREREICHPPQWAVNAVEARGTWPNVKPLTGVVEVPVLRADGSVLDRPGYDPATGIVLRANTHFPAVPTCPTLNARTADLPFFARTRRLRAAGFPS